MSRKKMILLIVINESNTGPTYVLQIHYSSFKKKKLPTDVSIAINKLFKKARK